MKGNTLDTIVIGLLMNLCLACFLVFGWVLLADSYCYRIQQSGRAVCMVDRLETHVVVSVSRQQEGTEIMDLVTCDNCDKTSETGWGDTPLCVDCQRKEDPSMVCEEHLLTRYPGEACPACNALGLFG